LRQRVIFVVMLEIEKIKEDRIKLQYHGF